jgi:predicted ribonuclease YlaK
MAKKTYVLDTNVPLTHPDSLYAFENNDILLPFKVLEELGWCWQKCQRNNPHFRQFARKRISL